jgi:hypothetical protein
MNIPVPLTSRSRARVVAAEKARAWREARKAETDTDAAIVLGLLKAARAFIHETGTMRCSPKPVDVHSVVVDAMAHLAMSGDVTPGEAKRRIIARLTHHTPRP